ncbi:MAG: hypothetical protein NW205_11005 [Hyphomicrobiaceae bacterium]|nr:hypothetical protein [Hyphomicrobiaceae bacterium]
MSTSNAPAGSPERRAVKLMSLSQAEYANSIEQLAGASAGRSARDGHTVSLPVGADGTATLNFTAEPGVTLGGLLSLPRARIEIVIAGAQPDEADAFLRRFEIAFQRGGG